MYNVFVYGSLKRGFHNHPVMIRKPTNGTLIDSGATPPIFDMLNLGSFPAVVKGDKRVFGEIYEVENLEALDRLEGYPDFYDRQEVNVAGHKCLIYTLNEENNRYGGHHVPPLFGNLIEWRI